MNIWQLLLVSATLLCSHYKGIDGVLVGVVIPPDIKPVNGSAGDMGCAREFTRNDVRVCECKNYIIDGAVPIVDTSTSDWASQLVTLRRNEGNVYVHFAHVLLTFIFDTAVLPDKIEIDLFHCPEWGIGAPEIYVYYNEEYDLTLSNTNRRPFRHVEPSQSSCDSLLTVVLPNSGIILTAHQIFFILVDLTDTTIQWVHVGEVRFFQDNLPIPVCPELTTTTFMTPSSIPLITSSTIIPVSLTRSTTALSTLASTMNTTSLSLGISLHALPTPSSAVPTTSIMPTLPTITSSTVVISHQPPESKTATVFAFPSTSRAPTASNSTRVDSPILSSSSTIDIFMPIATLSSESLFSQLSSSDTNSATSNLFHTTSPSQIIYILPIPSPSSSEMLSVAVDSNTPSPEIPPIIQKTTAPNDTNPKDMSFLPSTTETPTSTAIPVPPTKDIRSLVAALITIGVLITTITLSAIITIIIVLVFRKKHKKVPITIESYIEIGPLAPVRMDVPADEDDFGVHKVPIANGHENGNIYEIAK